MSESKETTAPVEDTSLFLAPTTIRNVVLNWLVPGLGYFLTGRRKYGIIVVAGLYTAYILGALLGGDLYDFNVESEGRIRFFGAICQAGMGLPYMLARLFLERGTPLNITYDYGTSYFLIAGMLNWLMVMDIFDISVKRK
ncbi:MAG: hypothetical protein QNK37_37665 [Acidobacteriota bacterium]|nr:hypothetical protein [Acidobacteriota bacterium]